MMRSVRLASMAACASAAALVRCALPSVAWNACRVGSRVSDPATAPGGPARRTTTTCLSEPHDLLGHGLAIGRAVQRGRCPRRRLVHCRRVRLRERLTQALGRPGGLLASCARDLHDQVVHVHHEPLQRRLARRVNRFQRQLHGRRRGRFIPGPAAHEHAGPYLGQQSVAHALHVTHEVALLASRPRRLRGSMLLRHVLQALHQRADGLLVRHGDPDHAGGAGSGRRVCARGRACATAADDRPIVARRRRCAATVQMERPRQNETALFTRAPFKECATAHATTDAVGPWAIALRQLRGNRGRCAIWMSRARAPIRDGRAESGPQVACSTAPPAAVSTCSIGGPRECDDHDDEEEESGPSRVADRRGADDVDSYSRRSPQRCPRRTGHGGGAGSCVPPDARSIAIRHGRSSSSARDDVDGDDAPRTPRTSRTHTHSLAHSLAGMADPPSARIVVDRTLLEPRFGGYRLASGTTSAATAELPIAHVALPRAPGAWPASRTGRRRRVARPRCHGD